MQLFPIAWKLMNTCSGWTEFPLINDILKKHGAEEEGELGQSQFAELLQPILQEIADALAKNHFAVIHNIKIVNGSELKKVGRYQHLIIKLIIPQLVVSLHVCLLKFFEGKLRNILLFNFLTLFDPIWIF